LTLKIRWYISTKGFSFYINLYPKEGRDEKGCVEIAHLGLQKETDLPFGGFCPFRS
jgi:hypothetical protein